MNKTKFGRKGEYCLFTIRNQNDGFADYNPTLIYETNGLSDVSVSYNYLVTDNSHRHEKFVEITKKEFLQRVKAIQKKHGIKFTIKY